MSSVNRDSGGQPVATLAQSSFAAYRAELLLGEVQPAGLTENQRQWRQTVPHIDSFTFASRKIILLVWNTNNTLLIKTPGLS